jgi:urea transport system substrate-binding protein
VQAFKGRFGQQRVVSAAMEAAYVGVHLWAEAAVLAGSTEPAAARQALRGLEMAAPSGRFRIDADTQYAWQVARVGQIGGDGQVRILWSSENPVRPEPFPRSRPRAQWEALLQDLYTRWGEQWEAPHP